VKHQSRAIAPSTNCETQKQGRAIACVADKRNEWEGIWIGANMPVANRIVRPPCPLAGRGLLSLSLSHSGSSCPSRAHSTSRTGCWCACPGRTQQHNWLLVGLPWLHPAPTSALTAGAPALGCTQHHTLSHYSTPRMVGVATVAAGAGAAEADEQHQAGWSFVASCSAAAGSMEQFRWTGTPRRWSYWQCSIGQHRRCCCRCSSGRSQYFL
jgi:hypothetical protein